jgi:2-amino-4-hydroxy-6-hydroxymethyldihydropteridine diphosphokinase
MTNAERSKDAEITVYLGLGSNLGDREANLREAIERIERLGVEIKRQSSVYETEPVGFQDQPWFLNQVVEGCIPASPTSKHGSVLSDPEIEAETLAETLLHGLLNIEHEMGRERLVANGPRVIDIDLLLFGDMVIAHSKDDQERSHIDRTDIFVPHPRMHLRRFVLAPLCELAPNLVHPVLKKTCREFLSSLDDEARVRIYEQS